MVCECIKKITKYTADSTMYTKHNETMYSVSTLIVGVVLLGLASSQTPPTIESNADTITVTSSDVTFNGLVGNGMSGTTISKIISDIVSNKQDITNLDSRLGDSEEKVLDAIQHSTSLNVSLQALLKDVVKKLENETQNHISRIDGNISSITSAMSSIQSDLNGLLDADFGSKISNVQTLLGNANQSIISIINSVNSTLTALKQRVQTNENTLERSKYFYDFETVLLQGNPYELSPSKWVHFTNTGNTGLVGDVVVPPWKQITTAPIGACGGGHTGIYNPPSNEVALFEDSEGTSNHVLFLQCGGIVQTTLDLILAKNLEISVIASVGGGNGRLDGGYDIGFFSAETHVELSRVRAGENGMPDTSNDGKYKDLKYTFNTKSMPTSAIGEKVSLMLRASKRQQAHVHYIHISVKIV